LTTDTLRWINPEGEADAWTNALATEPPIHNVDWKLRDDWQRTGISMTLKNAPEIKYVTYAASGNLEARVIAQRNHNLDVINAHGEAQRIKREKPRRASTTTGSTPRQRPRRWPRCTQDRPALSSNTSPRLAPAPSGAEDSRKNHGTKVQNPHLA